MNESTSISTFAFGSQVKATNWYAFATGQGTTAAGRSSVAMGEDITVNGANSIGFGLAENGTPPVVTNPNTMAIMGGSVGIGTVSPASKLHVSGGEVQLGSSGAGCTATNEGAQRYNSTTKRMDFCDGVSWQSLGTPAGSISAYSQSTCPGGWLAANGALVSRTTYAALFAAISTSYGVGDGSTTFKLPDYRGYFLRGWNNGSGVDPAAASRTNRGDGTTGDVVGSVQSDDNKSHAHGVTDPGHSHAQATMDGIAGANREVPQASSYGIDYGDGAGAVPTASSVTSISIQANGGAESRPKNINVLYCIKY